MVLGRSKSCTQPPTGSNSSFELPREEPRLSRNENGTGIRNATCSAKSRGTWAGSPDSAPQRWQLPAKADGEGNRCALCDHSGSRSGSLCDIHVPAPAC